MTNTESRQFRDKRWYGRRHGRKLRQGRQALIDNLLPSLRVPLPIVRKATVDLPGLFKKTPKAIWMEIGFGSGEHLAALAAKNPRVGFIGCEPFINGVASLLTIINEKKIENIRIFDDDVRLLIPYLREACLERIFVLFADPWPKHRHRNRRITVEENLTEFARLLTDDGQILFATDQHGFAAWSLANILRERRLVWTARRAKDWHEEPDNWTPTRYQLKTRKEGRKPVFINVQRRPRISQ